MAAAASDAMVDFSELPDVAWVHILKSLDLKERILVSQTCHSLNDVFNHPSLWYSAEIKLLGSMDRYHKHTTLMPYWYQQLVEKFGAYFQDLTLTISYFFHKLPQECLEVLDALSTNCRLKSLTLAVGTIVTKQDLYSVKARDTDLEVLANIVARAFKMKKFVLKSWPLYRNMKGINILQVLNENDKLNQLETLSLFWQGASEATWTTLNARLPPPEDILNTVCHFTALTSLCLQSTMLDDSIIRELAQPPHTPLKRLGIMLTYSRSDPTNTGTVPNIKSKSWAALATYCPELQVDITVVTRMPYFELHGFLKPEIPLSAISFMKYSRCSSEDFRALADKYHSHLMKFMDYSDGVDSDSHVIMLVTRCQHLTYFLYMGNIHCDAVKHLAKLRGTEWYYFQVNYDNILTHDQDIEYDDNQVLLQSPEGDYQIQKGPGGCQTEEEQEARRRSIVVAVSHAIGQKWQPVNSKMVGEVFAQAQVNTGVVPETAARAVAAEPCFVNL